MTYYSIYHSEAGIIRTDFAYYTSQQQLQSDFETHLLDNDDVDSSNVKTIWDESGYQIIETPLNLLNATDINILKSISEGENEDVHHGWFDEFEEIRSSDIKAIVEFREHGYSGSWYVVFMYHEFPLVIKHKLNQVNTSWMMSKYHIKQSITVYEMSYGTPRKLRTLFTNSTI